MGEDHAKLSPSAASRWMACPGSVRLSAAIPPRPASSYAQEGTDAHAVAAEALRKNADPLFWIGKEIAGVKVTSEMAFACKMYRDSVNDAVAPASLAIEQRVECAPDVWGTADARGLSPDGRTLVVVDFKYGRGVVVQPDSPQLKIYALGALKALPTAWASRVQYCRLIIVQPRADEESDWVQIHDVPRDVLEAWGEKELASAVAEALKADALCIPGDTQCRFCPALGVCEAAKTRQLKIAQAAFDAAGAIVLPAAETLTDEALQGVIDGAALLRAWLEAVEARALERAQAGAEFAGWELKKRQGHRKWTAAAEAALTGVLGEAAYSKELVSPAEAEKRLTALGEDLDISGLTIKPDLGMSLSRVKEGKRKKLTAEAIFGK